MLAFDNCHWIVIKIINYKIVSPYYHALLTAKLCVQYLVNNKVNPNT